MPLRRLNLAYSLSATLAILMCLCRPAQAGIGFQPVSPDELKMTSEPKAPGAPAIILFRQVDRDDNGYASHEDNYIRIKILTEEGRKHADIEIPFFKDSENIVAVKARTIRPDGSVADFDGKVFDKSIAKAKGLKYLAKTFTLPDVQVGGIIEYSYTRNFAENLIFDSHWILSNELFTKRAKFSLKRYNGIYESWGLRYSWQFLSEGTEPPKESPDHIVRLEAQNIPAFQTEDFMPPENELKSRVDFIYSTEGYEPDADKFWHNRGKKLHDRLESFIGKKKAMEQAISQIVAPADSPEVKARKIYARVQQIRNTSYEVRKTEEEQKRAKEKDNSNVEDVWKRGYGDGVELTWLYLALVRAAGIESYGVWASDRRNYFFNPKVMDSSKLDTNVVLLKLNGKDVFCDPGHAFAPFGMLPWDETGVTGLRMDRDGGSWVQTSLPESSASRSPDRSVTGAPIASAAAARNSAPFKASRAAAVARTCRTDTPMISLKTRKRRRAASAFSTPAFGRSRSIGSTSTARTRARRRGGSGSCPAARGRSSSRSRRRRSGSSANAGWRAWSPPLPCRNPPLRIPLPI
jgi:hypothetical protein